MKKIGTLIIIFSVLAFLTGCAPMTVSPTSYDSVVVGKNNPDTDIKAVQNAVDQGGTILLKGTFDFGNKGSVKIKNDISILGETGISGAFKTLIKGGFESFHSPLPPELPPQAPGPKIKIQNIHFDGALEEPINLAYSSGATIKGNRITNVRPMLIDEAVLGKSGLYLQKGIICTSYLAQPKETRRYQPGAITGVIEIADNEIDLKNEIPTKTVAHGVFVAWTTGATVKILGNTVLNCSRNSIETIDNYRGEDGSGIIIIKDNRIVTATEGVPVPTPSTPNGIIAGCFYDMSAGIDPARNPEIFIKSNYIETRGDTSSGIALLGDRVVVTNNQFVLSGGPKARGVLQLASNGLFANNKFVGSGNYAIFVSPHPKFKVFKASRNTFVLNDISSFKATSANALFLGDNNVLFGKNGKVISKGKGNQIIEDVE